MLQVSPRLGQHVRSGADRSHLIEEGIVGGILQHQQLDDNAAAEVPEYRGSDHKGLGHGVISTGVNYGLN